MQKFKESAFLLSEILRHQVVPLQFDIYPLELTKILKNRILCLIISFLALNYIPLCISLVLKQIKEFICSTFQETTAATPLVNRFPRILPELMAKEPPTPPPHRLPFKT